MIGAALCGLLQFLAFALPVGLPVCILALVSFINILGECHQRRIHIQAGIVHLTTFLCGQYHFLARMASDGNTGAALFTVSSSNSMIDCNHMERLIVNSMRLNAIRTGRSIVRCSEHGWSVVTDFRGRLIWSSSKKSEEFVVEVPVICPK